MKEDFAFSPVRVAHGFSFHPLQWDIVQGGILAAREIPVLVKSESLEKRFRAREFPFDDLTSVISQAFADRTLRETPFPNYVLDVFFEVFVTSTSGDHVEVVLMEAPLARRPKNPLLLFFERFAFVPDWCLDLRGAIKGRVFPERDERCSYGVFVREGVLPATVTVRDIRMERMLHATYYPDGTRIALT